MRKVTEARFDLEDAASKVYRKAEEIYKSSEIDSDTLSAVVDRYFSKTYSPKQLQTIKDYFVEQEEMFDIMYKEESKKVTEANELGINGLNSNATNIADTFINYRAYKNNFGPLVIVKQGKYYLIFKDGAKNYDEYIQECPSKDYVEGWLYGAVQCKNKIMENKKITEGIKLNNKDVRDLKSALATFRDNGKYAKRGNWSIGNGGYDLWYEISYDGLPVIGCTNGDIEVYTDEEQFEQYAEIVSDFYGDRYDKTTENKKVTEGKLQILPNSELPEYCYTYVASDNAIGIVKKGVVGYYPSNIEITADMTQEDIEDIVNGQNELLEVTPDQAFTMRIRSLNGWDEKITEDKIEDGLKYKATSYYDTDYKGVETDLETDDYDKIKEFVWEKVQGGNSVTVYNSETGETSKYTCKSDEQKETAEDIEDFLEEDKKVTESDNKEYDYMLLDRLKSDCDYYLGLGSKSSKHLWAGNPKDQILKMWEIWSDFSTENKPRWLTLEDLQMYAKEMIDEKDMTTNLKHLINGDITYKEYMSMNESKNIGKITEEKVGDILTKIKDVINSKMSNKLTAEVKQDKDVTGLKLTRKADGDLIALFDELVKRLKDIGFTKNDYEIELAGDNLILAMKNIDM